MNDMIQTGFDYAALPVEIATRAQIAASNIKLRLKRTVEDIIEIGRELTAVKAELPHGQFLPWIAAEFEMGERTANDFMNVTKRFGDKSAIIADLKPTILYALSAPSTPDSVIDKAIEKAASGAKVTIADVRDWKADYETEKQRSEEFRQESNERRKQVRTLEEQIHLLESRPAPKPEKVVVPPEDYETSKARMAELEAELVRVKKEQASLVNDQVRAKLHERQAELDKLERAKTTLEEQVARMTAYMANLDSEADRIEVHRNVIEKNRLSLIDMASFLGDADPISDAETLKRWRALAGMMGDAIAAIHCFTGDSKPALTVIRGDAA